MSNFLLRNFAIKLFLIVFMLSLGFLGFANKVQAAECGPYIPSQNRGTCNSGIEGATFWNSSDRVWQWTCDSDLCIYAPICGDGAIDYGEECDWPNLDGKACTDFPGYTGGDLFCTGGCVFDFNACTEDDSCGNGVVEKDLGEKCDGGNLDGQSCETVVGGPGILSCLDSCTFDTKECLYCGNGKADVGEDCDGSDLRGATCESLGLGTGSLGCSNCGYLVDGCTESEGECLNGILEAGEDCEWPNLFRDDASCDSLGCGDGTLICNNCVVETTMCEDPKCEQAAPESGCQNIAWSPWVENPFSKPCMGCGIANGKYYNEAPTTYLCRGSDSKYYTPTVTVLYDDNYTPAMPIGWQWICGTSVCSANSYPRCRVDLADQSGDESMCIAKGVGSYDTIEDYYAQRETNDTGKWGELCDVGLAVADSPIEAACETSTGDDKYRQYNDAWSCNMPGSNLEQVFCFASWGGEGVCGTEDGKEYVARVYDDEKQEWGLCSDSPFWDVRDKPENPDLCGVGSVLVSGSLEYEYILIDGTNYKHLTWNCRWERDTNGQDTQTGSIVDCSVKLNGYCPLLSVDGKCGDDTKKAFPVSNGPQEPGEELCELGIAVKDNPFFDTGDNTWYWDCAPRGYGTKTEHCSVVSSAVCANLTSGYATEAELRANTLCAVGELVANRVQSNSSVWYWYCSNGEDGDAWVRCSASKCGTAGEGVFSDSLFNSRVAQTGFLCTSSANSATAPTTTYNISLERSGWLWDCDYGSNGGYVKDCRATELECGIADGNSYLENVWNVKFGFYSKQIYWPTFLCTGGAMIDYVEPSASNDWQWSWNCQGDTGETILGGCSANAYRCGNYNDNVMLWETFDTNRMDVSYSDLFCSNGGVMQYVPNVGSVEWRCYTPGIGDDRVYIDKCSFKPMTCGTANNGSYTHNTLSDNNLVDNGFLCSEKGNGQINCSNGTCSWNCYDEWGDNLVECSASEVVCGASNGQTLVKPYITNSAYFTPCNGGNSISPDLEDVITNRSNGNDTGYDYSHWYWYCEDSEGGNTAKCVANCTEDNDVPCYK